LDANTKGKRPIPLKRTKEVAKFEGKGEILKKDLLSRILSLPQVVLRNAWSRGGLEKKKAKGAQLSLL